MQPRRLCNSLLFSAGWFGVRTQRLGRKPAVWETRVRSGWELEADSVRFCRRLPLQPSVKPSVSPGLCLLSVQWGYQHDSASGRYYEDKGISEIPSVIKLYLQKVFSSIVQNSIV